MSIISEDITESQLLGFLNKKKIFYLTVLVKFFVFQELTVLYYDYYQEFFVYIKNRLLWLIWWWSCFFFIV